MIKKLLASLILILILGACGPPGVLPEEDAPVQTYLNRHPYMVGEMTIEEALIVIARMRDSHVQQIDNALRLGHDNDRLDWEYSVIRDYDRLRGLIERLSEQ